MTGIEPVGELDPREDDFLDFWRVHRAQLAGETRRILGVDVLVPTELPMALTDQAAQLMHSTDLADVERVVGMLFGPDVYARWKANGLTLEMLPVLMTWGMANGAGQPTTFEQAVELTRQAQAAQEAQAGGKASSGKASSATRRSAGTGR